MLDVEGYSEMTSFNIDIEFFGVAFMEVPERFNSIEIVRFDAIDTAIMPAKLVKYFDPKSTSIFQISDGIEKHYVIASGVYIGKNSWSYEFCRIVDPRLKYDEVLYSDYNGK